MAIARQNPGFSPGPVIESGELEAALSSILGERRIILASNRGPVQYALDRRGVLVPQRGQGGLVSSLTSLLRHARVSWVASCITPGDREAARRQETSRQDAQGQDSLRLRLVNVPEKAYQRHYEVFANPILWFIHHNLTAHLLNRPATRVKEAWRWGYVPVNRAMASGVLAELGHGDTAPWVFIHDYHLYLTGHFVRRWAPFALLQHFVHIPWPAPGVGLQVLGRIWSNVIEGLLSNDIVGLQTEGNVRNFLQDCRLSLRGVKVDPLSRTVSYKGRVVRVRAYPISVDADSLREEVRSLKVQAYRRSLETLCGEKTIVQVERVDPSKNTPTSLEAFRLLLESHPDLAGSVNLLAFLVPSRTGIPEYQRYGHNLMAQVKSINERFARGGHQPVHVFYENNYHQGLAGMSLYDVLLVNPLADGMNLVAKEGPIVNQKDGVLVLSRGAGAHAQLSSGAVSIRPDDVQGTAEALFQALFMPPEERRRRAHLLRRAIEAEDLTHWLFRQLCDILALDAERRGSGRPALNTC